MSIGFVIAALNGADQFTGDVDDATQTEASLLGFDVEGPFNLSIVGTYTGPLTIQRRFIDGDDANIWRDVNVFDALPGEYHDIETEAAIKYRIGFKAGASVTGTANVRLSN